MTRPFCVGLTGGIGSGKSVVSQAFAQLGAGVVDTDVIAHTITAPDGAAIPALVEAFGPACLATDGGLDRKQMRERIFHAPALRTQLENILHPLIRAEAKRQIECIHAPYVLLVVPLLIESMAAYTPLIDRVLVVDCDRETQKARVQQRSPMPSATLDAILARQVDRETRLKHADDVIENRGSLEALNRRIDVLHNKYLQLAAQLRAV